MKRALCCAAATLFLAGPAMAQDAAQEAEAPQPADTVLELLELVRLEASEGSRANRERVARFRQARNERQRLLEEVSRELAAENRRSATLSRSYEQNEVDLADLSERLEIRIGNFGELFGVVRDSAADAVGTAYTSLVSAQYPQRTEQLRDLAEVDELPSLEDLRRIQLAFLEEMAESGQVARFNAEITDPTGQKRQGEVIRVGAFVLVHDGEFLTRDSATGALRILPRQPAGRFVNMAEDLVEATSGIVRMAIDPSQGQLLGLLIQAPNLAERIQQGGYVGYTIIGMGAIGLLIALWRMYVLQGAGRRIRSQLRARDARDDNALGRILLVNEKHRSGNLDALALKLDEAIMREVPSLQRYQGIIKVFAAVAPLLGLLGTVVGMIITFQQLTLFGTGDPKLMAGGISQALITTVLGLIVAIPLVLLHSVVSSSSQALVEILEEQSAGLIARKADADAEAAAA